MLRSTKLALTQSYALASLAQTRGHSRGLTARDSIVDRMSSSSVRERFELTGSMMDEHEIHDEVSDLYSPL
jgi:hypothetical protein